MGKFDSKSFNPQAFKYSVENPRVPNLKTNELKKSRALKGNSDIRNVFTSQNGTAYAVLAMKGLLDGEVLNYDGQTDITATSTKTFERGVVVIGRAKAWTEKDFSDDISGEHFMDNVADQVAEYWDEIDQDTLLAILDGIFSMTGTKNLEFVNKHTYTTKGNMESTTLNSAINQACGSNKKKFTVIIMHSDVSTNLENLNLVKHLTYTDKDGLTRDIELGTWNGKLVVVDDEMPVKEVADTYVKTTDTSIVTGKEYYTKSGSTYSLVAEPTVANIGSYYEKEPAHVEYTSYTLGDGAIDYENIGAKVPYEMDRNPSKNGGEDTLYTRQRKVFAPYGISYTKAVQVSLSPTDTELKNGANWSLVNSGETIESDRSYINHKAIPIARIISRG